MTHPVLYRKYRPQRFAEVAGQDPVTQTLRNALAMGRLAHAYLFCGPRGTGKTSTGRILAKAVSCMEPVNGEPCNECAMCTAFNEGRALDIIEIDAASNRGIDDIRELRERVNYAPAQAKYKVYIIDEVHMLTDAASNALLKTLEEPPAHTFFVLATTEAHKVLPTILSRCQRFDFRRIPQASVIARLAFIAEKEGFAIQTESLRLVAHAATGSLRDAANILEQLVAYFGKEITLPQVRQLLGVTGDDRVRILARQVIAGETGLALQTVAALNADGLDLRQFNRELTSFFRDLLLIRSGAESTLDLTAEDLNEIKKDASTVTPDRLLKLTRAFNDIDLKLDGYSPLPIEMAVVEATLTEEKPAVEPAHRPAASVRRAEAIPTVPAGPKPSTQTAAHPAQHPATSNLAKPPEQTPAKSPEPVAPMANAAPSPINNPVEEATAMLSPAAPTTPTTTPPTSTGQINLPGALARWDELLVFLQKDPASRNLKALLKSGCTPVAVEGEMVTLGFPSDYLKSRCEEPANHALTEQKLTQFFGQPIRISCRHTPRENGAAAVTPKPAPQPHASTKSDNYLARAAMDKGARPLNPGKPPSEEK
jgi:DNA polymerase-3 subunit gamma/tau